MSIIVWLRNDLRVHDNPALAWAVDEAARRKVPVVPVYIYDDANAGPWMMGGASRWWLQRSLAALGKDLPGLVLRRGDPHNVLPQLARESAAGAVVWNRRYTPWAQDVDRDLTELLKHQGTEVHSFKAGLLFEPWEVATGSRQPFKVFTPFWKACVARKDEIETPLPAPEVTPHGLKLASDDVNDWGLAPGSKGNREPRWDAGWETIWTPGEAGAQARLKEFIGKELAGYATKRDIPALPHVSRLSPHLHFGEISPRQIWQAAQAHPGADATKFLSELGWREFSHHLLAQAPELPAVNWRRAFDHYPWKTDKAAFTAWCRGQTGYPFVDAGMRQLWQTGWMHNRVRLVTASFLIKHLQMDWRDGEKWFWDTLVDADLAQNAANWQWVAGSGADAAPYFRIFNPFGQGQRFDAEGAYVRQWCPELAKLPDDYIHTPWEAPEDVLQAAGVLLGKTYPRPMVDHAEARAMALEGFETVKRAERDRRDHD